jgi:hypothetical protein
LKHTVEEDVDPTRLARRRMPPSLLAPWATPTGSGHRRVERSDGDGGPIYAR